MQAFEKEAPKFPIFVKNIPLRPKKLSRKLSVAHKNAVQQFLCTLCVAAPTIKTDKDIFAASSI